MKDREKPAPRLIAMAVVAILMFSVLIGQLLNVQIRQGGDYLARAESSKVKRLSLSGARGTITDKSGIRLAYDQASYNVTFFPEKRMSTYKAEYVLALQKTIEITERNGGKTIDRFAILRDVGGAYHYDWRTTIEEAAGKRRDLWFKNWEIAEMNYEQDISAQQAYEMLCAYFELDVEDWEGSRKVLAILEDWKNKAFLGQPIPIASDVKLETMAQIEARQVDLPGVAVVESTVRVYPRGGTAAHIVGYMGSISEERLDEYITQGYGNSDLVGLSGIERSMEVQLSGNTSVRQGLREVEVNSSNRVTREVGYYPPTNGDNIVLTIDLTLQDIVEQELARNIESIRLIQLEAMATAKPENKAKYNNAMISRGTKTLALAATGVAVVMEVKTGKVLALASYPSFDPNDFVGGLSDDNYQLYFNTDESELARLSPTYNRAISTRATPGSIFKMVTGLAGVEENVVGLYEKIDDESPFSKYAISGKAPSCWLYRSRPWALHEHGDMTLSKGITNSCNYYFYTVADRLGIDKINHWATRLGLTSKTGIELPGETTGLVGSRHALYDVSKGPDRQNVARTREVVKSVRSELYTLRENLQRGYEDERLENVLEQLMLLVDDESMKDNDLSYSVRQIMMTQMGLTNEEVASTARRIYLKLYDLRWTPNETILTGIGQSITETTPIAVARYLSALANGGKVYEAQIVDRIVSQDGRVLRQKEPVLVGELGDVGEALEQIKMGMRGVVDAGEGGTAAKYWRDYPYTDQVAGKTGTAQVNLIDIENNAWFASFAPYDDPEIAVVVFIANGMSAGHASPTAQAVYTYYFENKEQPYNDPEPMPGEWLP